MMADRSFDDWMLRLRAGDGEAVRGVVERYTHRLIALARRRLEPRLRQIEIRTIPKILPVPSYGRRHAE